MNTKEAKGKRPKRGCNDFGSTFKSFQEMFDIDSVPEAERKEVAQGVADWVV